MYCQPGAGQEQTQVATKPTGRRAYIFLSPSGYSPTQRQRQKQKQKQQGRAGNKAQVRRRQACLCEYIKIIRNLDNAILIHENIGGLVVEYNPATVETRVRFPVDAFIF